MNKKIFSLFLIAILLISTLVSCGQSSTPPPSSSAQSVSANSGSNVEPDAPREPVTIKMFYPMMTSHTTDDYGGVGDELLAEKTGVIIEWELAPATNIAERFNIMMASGNIPDVVVADPTATSAHSLKKYQDAFLPLDDYIIGKRPNLEQAIYGDDYVYKYLVTNENDIRIIPQLATRTVGDIFLMRGDILEKHNLEVPNTSEEWVELFRKIKELEPDMTIYASRHGRTNATPNVTRMAEAWGVKEDIFYEDGEIKYGILDPRYKEFIAYARNLYAEGLLDQEYITADTAIWQEKILTNGVFATHDNITRIRWTDEQFAAAGKDDQYYIGVLPMIGPDGTRATTIQYPRIRTVAASLSVKTPYAEQIMDMYEYVFSEEGTMLVNYGVEGVSYDMINGLPTPNEQYRADVAAKKVISVGITRDQPMLQVDELTRVGNSDVILAAKELYESNQVIKPDYITPLIFTEDEIEILTRLKTELDTYRNEMVDKFITGIDSMDNYDAFVAEFSRRGVDELLDIYNAALQRYLAA